MPAKNPQLAQEFLKRKRSADAMRRNLQARINTGRDSSDLQERCDRIDEENMHFLNEVITQQGGTWPGIRLLGEDGAKAGAEIAQRSNFSEAVQDAYVQLAETAFQAGDIAPSDYASLVDIRLLHRDGVQRYGMHGRVNQGTGEFEMEATQDSDNLAVLDTRRQSIGLEPILEHAARLQEKWEQDKIAGLGF